MKKQSPPAVPARGFTIPIVTPTEPGFLFFTMLRSYKLSVAPAMKAGAASMAFGQLLRHPELLRDRMIRQVTVSALSDVEYSIRSLSVDGPLDEYFLRETVPRVRAAIAMTSLKSEIGCDP